MARGRKPQARLWLPTVVQETGPILLNRFIGTPMGQVIESISKLPLERFRDNKAITISTIYVRWAMAEALRHKYGVNLVLRFDGKPLDAKTRDLVAAEGLVFSRLLDLIEGVFTLYPDYDHPARWWLLCCVAPNCHTPSATLENQTERGNELTSTVTRVRRIYEENTSALKRDENPFEAEPSKRLFAYALSIAGDVSDDGTARRGDEFHRAKLKPYIDARVALAKLLRKPGVKLASEPTEPKGKGLNLNNPYTERVSANRKQTCFEWRSQSRI